MAYAIAARLLPDTEKDLCKAVQAVDHSSFPAEMSPEFREADVRLLCDRFGLRFNDIKNYFREFKDSRGAVIPNGMKQLKNCINTLPVSTEECERGFSKMNIICSSLRSKLTVSHISSLMFVPLCGPPLSLWEPIKYVKSWLVLKRRSANCTRGQWQIQGATPPPMAAGRKKF